MKCIVDNVCLIDSKDLFNKSIFPSVVLDKQEYSEDEIVVVTDSKSVEYLKNREDVLDFDKMFSFSDEELDKKIISTGKAINKLLEDNVMCYPGAIKRALANKEFRDEFNYYDRLEEELIAYRNDRDEINQRFLNAIYLFKGNSKRYR